MIDDKNKQINTITEFKTVKQLVLSLLKEDERCRNDDKWLTFRVMQHYTKIYIPYEDFVKIPAFETVKRTRANIQNDEGLFLPTSVDVLKKRHRRQEDVVTFLQDEKVILNE